MSNYLDKDGLIRLWSKIKAYINDSTKNVASELTDAEIEDICDFEQGMIEDVIPKATGSALGCVVVGDGLDVDVNGVLSNGRGMDLLWTNASPSSGFVAQTISLDLSDYDKVTIEYIISVGATNYKSETANVGNGMNLLDFTGANNAGVVYVSRIARITTTGVVFEASYGKTITSSSGGGTVASNLIPTAIYGIKGVS